MASEANKLRQIASVLRKEAAEIETRKMIKCGQVIQASVGLTLLMDKVRCHG